MAFSRLVPAPLAMCALVMLVLVVAVSAQDTGDVTVGDGPEMEDAADAAGDGAPDVGPAIGQRAPHDLALSDARGEVLTHSQRAGANGTVVVFVRSADWCPLCKRQLIGLNSSLDAFVERGYALVSVSTDTPEKLAKFTDRRGIGFTMLADPDSVAIDAFGVRDPAFPEGHRAFGVPYPIGFVLNGDGVIVDKFYHVEGYGQAKGYRTRVSTEDVIAALDAMLANGGA